MEVIVHYPKSQEGKKELAKRVSEMQARAVVNYINNLPFPKEQKLRLLDAAIKEARKIYGDANKAQASGSN